MEENISGRRLREARLLKKPPINQQEMLAKLQSEGINISQSTLSKIENGNRYVTDIELMAFSKILNVDINWLMGKVDTDNPS